MTLDVGVRLGPFEIQAPLGAGGATLEDLESRNGTYVGGVRITGPVTVKDGDTVRFGNLSVVFRSLAIPASTVPMTTGP